jgi:hypothetical protein
MTRPRILLAAACLGCASPASADLTSACFRDYLRFRSTVMPGEGRIVNCLNSNWASLSPPCGEAFAAVASCGPEIECFCQSVQEPSQIKTCLMAKSVQLGDICRQNLRLF